MSKSNNDNYNKIDIRGDEGLDKNRFLLFVQGVVEFSFTGSCNLGFNDHVYDDN